ncbi:hypothetical protein HW115_04940 [Verrucomicrobiaceae bacterium N1E253]|uniref:Uncharacterized protein n=1 Tax=Oceaniferula marina TaxID=2748318 RepID=A0A851GBF6_9BACT|nr:hypothetical protein [Oceaniferula marina]NWK54943.1 hypothetical protein [Oceaniferula marina]
MIIVRKLLILCLLAMPAMGGFKVPEHVYPIDQLDQAQSKAEEKKSLLAFVYTDPGST